MFVIGLLIDNTDMDNAANLLMSQCQAGSFTNLDSLD